MQENTNEYTWAKTTSTKPSISFFLSVTGFSCCCLRFCHSVTLLYFYFCSFLMNTYSYGMHCRSFQPYLRCVILICFIPFYVLHLFHPNAHIRIAPTFQFIHTKSCSTQKENKNTNLIQICSEFRTFQCS